MKITLTIFLLVSSILCSQQNRNYLLNKNDKSDVFLQGFYWNSTPGGIWWDSLKTLSTEISSAGFGGIWIPSIVKGAGGSFSMGYDPYDHYDFGNYFQKGTRETRFGSKSELENMIKAFHSVGIEVYADVVMNHMNGGEKMVPYECHPNNFPDSAWLQFSYPNGSGRFKKDASHFYPNSQTCDVNPPYHGADDPIFSFGEWLAHDRDFVRDSLIVWGKYLKSNLGVDGFRIDAVKGMDPIFAGQWLKSVNADGGYAVAEYFGDIGAISYWHNQTQNVNNGKVSMFDFPLRYTLKDMCNNTSGSFDMNKLDGAGLVNSGLSGYDVATFVENHDMDRTGYDGSKDSGHDPILSDKDMAYAYILFSEGKPCVFFRDYFIYGYKSKIDTLIWIRKNLISGGTTKRDELNPWYVGGNGNQTSLSKDIYVAKRNGSEVFPETFLVLNDNPTEWLGVWVNSNNPNSTFRDFTGVANDKKSGNDGRVELWAPPRGYAIYAPNVNISINHSPVLSKIEDLKGYTGSIFNYKLNFNDADNDKLTFILNGHPQWLSVTSAGLLKGVPELSDVGTHRVTIKIQDPSGLFAIDTFNVSVELNHSPVLAAIDDQKIKATKRFELKAEVTDSDNDPLTFALINSPSWLKIGLETGIISGTPSIKDTGEFKVLFSVYDGKGASDSMAFNIFVKENIDSVIETYGKPNIDGTVHVNEEDWLDEWLLVSDSDSDSYWRPKNELDNELLGLYSTWDSDSLYIGVDYRINDNYNTLILYFETGLTGGVTNFNSEDGYQGDYAKNNVFRINEAPDNFLACYYNNKPTFYSCDTNSSMELTDRVNGVRGKNNSEDLEIAISWDDLYSLGAGTIPANVELKIISLVSGGLNWGSGDSMPDNIDTDGDSGPDSLTTWATINPDKNGDGIPDPTIIFTNVENINELLTPQELVLEQNFPNPFNPTTNIRIHIAKPGFVKLDVFNILGERVDELINKNMDAGIYHLTFDGSKFASGTYIYRLSFGNKWIIKKMILLK